MQQFSELEASNGLLSDVDALKERMDRDGCFLIRGLLPRDAVRNVRLEIMEACRSDGLIDEHYPLEEGRMRSGRSHSDFMAVQDGDCWGLESLHNLMHRPEITSVAEDLVGETVTPFIHKAIRLRAPEDAVTDEIPYISTAHQDYIFVQGSLERNYTCWVPLGDITANMGVLEVLRGSHRSGVYPVCAHADGGIGVDDSSLAGEWLTTEYEMGDALFFHTLVVHRAPPNMGDRIRLSTDCRYQGLSEPFSSEFVFPLMPKIENAYKNWKSKELQYFWKKLDIKRVEYDHRYNREAHVDAICRGRAGDQRVVAYLRGLSNDAKWGAEAKALLARLESAAGQA